MKNLKKVSKKEMENTQGGKFWGSQTNCGGKIYDVYGNCSQNCHDDYYVLWIKVNTGEGKMVDC